MYLWEIGRLREYRWELRYFGHRGEAGDHGCENIAAGDSVTHTRLCLLCHAGPVGECNEFGTLLTVWTPPAQRLKGGPVRCCDVWDTRCPTCTSGNDRSCSMRSDAGAAVMSVQWGESGTRLIGRSFPRRTSGTTCRRRHRMSRRAVRDRPRRNRGRREQSGRYGRTCCEGNRHHYLNSLERKD